jgi:phage gp29-like protein
MIDQPKTPTDPLAGTSIGDKQPEDFFREDAAAAPVALPTEPNASITPDRIQFSLRMRFNPIRGLTPDLLSQYLDQFRLGFFRNPALAWDAMERRDSRLQTVAPKRKKSVSRHGWEVLTIEDSAEAKAQQKFLTAFYNNVSATTALEPDEQGGMSLLLRQMMDAVGKRYAVHEIVWQPMPDGSLKAKFIFCPLWWFEGTRGKLRFLTSEFQIYGIDMDAGGWLVTVGDGIMEACSVAYIFKHLPLRDWLNFSERFGTPGVVGKTDAAINSPEWNLLEDAVKNFSNDWGAVTNLTNGIELIESKGTGDQPFQPLVDMMNEEMTRLWRGSDLGTSSKSDSVGASLQGDESEILEVDDAAMLSETLTLKVSRFALNWKFGPDAPQLAYIKIKASEKQDTQLDLLIYQFLLTAGFPISQSNASERFGVPIPKDGEDLLTAPAAPDPKESNPDTSIANAQRTLEESSRLLLASAVQDDLSHVLSRLNDILQIEDGELFLKKLQAFAADFPQFKKDILADPAAARALQPILGAALANGLATKPTS